MPQGLFRQDRRASRYVSRGILPFVVGGIVAGAVPLAMVGAPPDDAIFENARRHRLGRVDAVIVSNGRVPIVVFLISGVSCFFSLGPRGTLLTSISAATRSPVGERPGDLSGDLGEPTLGLGVLVALDMELSAMITGLACTHKRWAKRRGGKPEY
jgi:hypothetical protein